MKCPIKPFANYWWYAGLSKGKYSWGERRVLEDMIHKGKTTLRNAAKYIVTNQVHLQMPLPKNVPYGKKGMTKQGMSPAVGASWTISGDININPKQGDINLKSLNDLQNLDSGKYNYVLALVSEEAKHLEQGAPVALSVYGEHEGWQTKFTALEELGVPPPDRRTVSGWIVNTPLKNDYEQLDSIWKYMVASQGGYPDGFRYLVWLLPRQPLYGLYKP